MKKKKKKKKRDHTLSHVSPLKRWGFQRRSDGACEIQSRSVGRKSAPMSAGLELVEVTSLRCSAYGRKSLLSSTSPGPSVVEPIGKDNLGGRGAADTRAWRAWAPAGTISWAAGGRLPGAGWPESDRACAAEKLEGELRQREQTSMESFKSTWRAVRFLSIRDGPRREGAWSFGFGGLQFFW